MNEAAPISPYWEHLCIGQWVRIIDQDRVKGTVLVVDKFPDGRMYRVTLKIENVEPWKNE